MTKDECGDRLFAQAREGQGAATAAVIEGLRPRIARLARYYASRSPEEAADLEQEAWVAILEGIPQLRLEVGDPRQYLLRLGKWRMLNFLNEQAARRHEELTDDFDQPAPSRTPADAHSSHLLERIFADRTIVRYGLDVEKTSVGLEADLPQSRQVLQEFADAEVARVIDGGFGA